MPLFVTTMYKALFSILLTLFITYSGFSCECHPSTSFSEQLGLKTTNHSSWLLNYCFQRDLSKKEERIDWYRGLLQEPMAFRRAINELAERYRYLDVDVIVSLDSKDVLLGSSLAYELHLPFLMLSKEKISECLLGQRVVILEGLLAEDNAGLEACIHVEKQGGQIAEVACLLEFSPLKGRDSHSHPVFSLIAIE